MNRKQKGDKAEHFVAEYLANLAFVVEIHPRTFRPVRIKGGRTVMVSKDNDYHNAFDIKAEGIAGMIYAQVKYMPDGTASSGHIAGARRTIDCEYPYDFSYIRPQVWLVWETWVKPEKGRRHKEVRFRIQERHGFGSKMWKKDGELFPKGNWVELEMEGGKSNYPDGMIREKNIEVEIG